MMKNRTLIVPGRVIDGLIDMPDVLRIVESAFRLHGEGRVQMPAKIYLHLDKYHGDFRAMPGYIEGIEACGIKWVNVHPRNKAHGLPSVMGVIILNDPRTGLALAIMDGTRITSMRTGAAGGVAAKFLARRNSSNVALVGCGVQAYYQLLALNAVFGIKRVSIYDSEASHAAAFKNRMKGLHIKTTVASSVKDCVRCADIVVTTTPSRRPIVMSGWIRKGAHINAIGADAKGKEELDPKILKKAVVVVDDIRQASHSGEINVALSKKFIKTSDIKATLGEVITKKKRARMSENDVTVFDSTGLAIQDIAVADFVYKKCLSRIRAGSMKPIWVGL